MTSLFADAAAIAPFARARFADVEGENGVNELGFRVWGLGFIALHAQ